MKALLSLILMFAVLSSLSACGGINDDVRTETSAETDISTETGTKEPILPEDYAWSFEGGVLTISGKGAMPDYYDKEASKIISRPWDDNIDQITEVIICDGITTVGSGAFINCISLEKITLPESVTLLKDMAFYNCVSLSGIALPETVTALGDMVFYSCLSLNEITFPETVTSLGNLVFYDCKALTSFIIPHNVTTIGYDIFYGCESLKTVFIPAKLKILGESMFYGCAVLESITYGGTINEWFDLKLVVPEGTTVNCSDGIYE